LNDTPMS